ncbi:MAG TPA: hypothetical protein DCX32_00850 [Candidatus Moranbacteria bacterium]|nr:hypothetical protein [Candidatus Moranbacteria bacterium]
MKKSVYGLVAALVAVPSLAFAQFQAPSGTNLPSASLTNIITNIMNWLLMIVGILGVIGFVIAGILYLTAAGDGDMIDRAKKAMVYSIVGVLVALIGLVVIRAVQGLLGASRTF